VVGVESDGGMVALMVGVVVVGVVVVVGAVVGAVVGKLCAEAGVANMETSVSANPAASARRAPDPANQRFAPGKRRAVVTRSTSFPSTAVRPL
jgi:hypothetical protein